MISVKFDTKDLSKKLMNVNQYSKGFFDGIQNNRLWFNNQLGMITKEALEKYIDVKARMEPEALHHVYEWNMVGSPSGRLFNIEYEAGINVINFYGNFLPSQSVSDSSDEPFVEKAEIMENQIEIQVEPRFNSPLAFESDGQQVFSMNAITIDNPGGNEVAGSFGKVVENFFDFYFTTSFLKQSGILEQLQYPKEYADGFLIGVNDGGYTAGTSSAKKYMSIKGGVE